MAEIKERSWGDIPMKRDYSGRSLTTFGSGGRVRYLVQPRDTRELIRAISLLKEEGIPWRVIGMGSNLLFPDEGFDGAILKVSAFDSVEKKGSFLTAGAGVKLPFLSRIARDVALSGLEFASGIPGETGGSTSRNAGAFGQSMSDVIREITLLREGRIERCSVADLRMEYHRGNLPQGAIVLAVKFRLSQGDKDHIDAMTAEIRKRRRDTQPSEPSAGSVFRRVGDLPAARFIEETGLKGSRIGGALLSAKHCNFIVNAGGATTKEYFELAELVAKRVEERAGVSLEYEVEEVVCSKTENSEKSCISCPPTVWGTDIFPRS